MLMPDIYTAVAFLTTKVKDPMKKDRKKLVRVLVYLKGIPDQFWTLSMKDTKLIKWWVGVSYTVHGDMRIHTGGMMPMGKGVMYSTYHI